MSEQGVVVEDEQWVKVQDARVPWVAFKSRFTDGWPGWVRKLDVELKAWLHGEKVVYAEYGCALDGASYSGTAIEADGLWATILTERYVARVWITKEANSPDVATPDVTVVPRSAITSLSIEVKGTPGLQGPPIVTRVTFDGLVDEIQIPADADSWMNVDPKEREAIFAGLRDDLFL